ncbi:hypothetical protein [Parasitella parasitica]|uniref:Uncharacterized protein n=1 Tax=Parasitella parasitica TaxID=35722 RepID=A0A0B7NB31_9FUNG|nr:hypothetical protein [Parasitella parasitica]
MVRAVIFVSALVALVATVSAIPRPDSPLVDVDAGHHLGTGDLNFDEALQDVVNANDLQVQDVAYDVNAVAHDDDDEGHHDGCDHHHHHGGLLHGLLKREAPAGTVRIARQNRGRKMMNKKSAKKVAAAGAKMN